MAMSPQELQTRIRGPIHLVMTPFDENVELDETALRQTVGHVAESLTREPACYTPASNRVSLGRKKP